MKRFFEKLSVILLSVCMIFAAAALAACDDGEKIAYTVTVLLEDGTPVEGVKVSLGDNGPYATDEQGVATAELEKADYTVTVDAASLPEGCSAGEGYKVTSRLPSATITLTKDGGTDNDKILYTVKVLYPDGTPAKGLMVGFCLSADQGGTCSFPDEKTNDDGETSIELPAATYNVQLPQPPAGYTYDKDGHNYYTGAQATADNPKVTITLKNA